MIRSRIFSINYSSLSDLSGLVPGVISNLLSLPSLLLLLPLSSSLLPFSLSPFFSPLSPLFPSPQHEKIAPGPVDGVNDDQLLRRVRRGGGR